MIQFSIDKTPPTKAQIDNIVADLQEKELSTREIVYRASIEMEFGIISLAAYVLKRIRVYLHHLSPIAEHDKSGLLQITGKHKSVDAYLNSLANLDPSRELVCGEFDMLAKFSQEVGQNQQERN